jgi:hypothetical protein
MKHDGDKDDVNVISMRKNFQVRFISCEFIDYKLLISIGRVIHDEFK